MSPIDGQVMVPGSAVAMGLPQQQAGGFISLGTLMEFIIQSTHHELVVLSELLPRRTDMERKIEIVQFASRTRQRFVRLLALVKWANSASKVDKCGHIGGYLDQQAMLFVDTADLLAKTSRGTLVRARLPSFSIPCAIDVLTTGTYPRLPVCIKEKIVPPDPITQTEKYQTLFRLNQIIEHRLVTTDLPKHMRRPKIHAGRVIFRVQHEFEVTLTLMGDGPNVPWRLLDIEILVEDPETGGGKALVHSMQVMYIHQLVQARLMDNDKPLDDIYNVLHSFCQSLQLEVLYSQSQQLITQRLGDHIRIEEYIPSKKLILSYWRNQQRRDSKPAAHFFKLTVFVDEHSPSKPLQISHFPQIQGSESIKVAQTIKSDHLSLEKLLMHTIQIRSLSKLRDLEREFRLIHVTPAACEMRNLPTVLYAPIIHPCMMTEKLAVSVDMHTGHYMASLCGKEISMTNDIEQSLNSDKRELRRHLTKLRLWLGMQRCHKTAQHLNVTVHESLPFVNINGHPLEKLKRSHLFIRLSKMPNYLLVVECVEARVRGRSGGNSGNIQYNYYLLQTEQVTPAADTNPTIKKESGGESTVRPEHELKDVYLKAGFLTQLDTNSCTHGAGSRLYDVEEEDAVSLNRKRKLLLGDSAAAAEPLLKKQRVGGGGGAGAVGVSSYFVPELAHVLAMCADTLPIMHLCQELHQRGISSTGVNVVDNGAGFGITLHSGPPVSGLPEASLQDLNDNLLSYTIRIHRKHNMLYWHSEAMMSCCPLVRNSRHVGVEIDRVHWIYGESNEPAKNVQSMLDDWTAVATLYDAVLTFAEEYKVDKYLQSEIEIKNYNYKWLTLAYGSNKCYTCTVYYSKSSEGRAGQFQLTLATVGAANISNCHTLMLTQLQRELNQSDGSIAKLAQTLACTWPVVQSVGKLNATAMMGLNSTQFTQQKQPTPTCSFIILAQSTSHLRIFFRQSYCVDIHCEPNNVVSVRDGAYSKFGSSQAVDGCIPVPGLKAFLNMFQDDTVISRRRSTIEDDNPPSPSGLDYDQFLHHQQQHTSSPGSVGAHHGGNPRSTKHNFPLTPGSHPGTPASPVTSRGSNQPMVACSPSNMMAPSPSNPAALHVPSPAAYIPAPSPSSMGIHMPSPSTNQFISPQGGVGASSVLSPPPARMLPTRAWAASVPTILSHASLGTICSPQPAAPGAGSNVALSPLEKFLASAFTRKHILRIIPAMADEGLSLVKSNEPTAIIVKAESMQLRFGLHPQHLQSLCLKITSEGMPGASGASAAAWEQDELTVLEKFFEMRVVVYPYRLNAVNCFMKIICMPLRILKDVVQIMRLELAPEKNQRWSVQLCLTIPPSGNHGMNYPGGQMVLSSKGKYLIGLQMTRLPPPASSGPSAAANQSELSIFVPVLYDSSTNKTAHASTRTPPPAAGASAQAQQQQQQQAVHIINQMFQRCSDFNPKPTDCSLYPAVCELLSNLQLPG